MNCPIIPIVPIGGPLYVLLCQCGACFSIPFLLSGYHQTLTHTACSKQFLSPSPKARFPSWTLLAKHTHSMPVLGPRALCLEGRNFHLGRGVGCTLILIPFLSATGDYFPEKSTKHVFDSAPSHSISARTKTFRIDSTPGLQQPTVTWTTGVWVP